MLTPELEVMLSYILKSEGGFNNNPKDRGGATNFGITQDDLQEWRKTPVSIEDVKNMRIEEAREIYWLFYLKPLGCDKLNHIEIAICLADTGVLYGISTTIKLAQKVCNGYGYRLTVDGIMGPLTLAALNSINAMHFVNDFHTLLLARIEEIVKDDVSQKIFKAGWISRANKLLELV